MPVTNEKLLPYFGLYLEERVDVSLSNVTYIRENVKVPLESIHYDVKIFEHMSEIEIVQVYENKSDKPVDVCYYFPKTLESSFTGLTCTVGNQEIVTFFEKREKAAELFQQAVEQGQTAILSTTPVQPKKSVSRDNSMKIYIGNFPAFTTLVAKFKVVYDVPITVNNYHRFVLPLEMRNLHPGFTDTGDNGTSIFVPYTKVNNALILSPSGIFNKKAMGLENKPGTNKDSTKVEE